MLNIEDYYTQDEIDMVCMYYGQIPDNLTRNMQIMLVEILIVGIAIVGTGFGQEIQ